MGYEILADHLIAGHTDIQPWAYRSAQYHRATIMATTIAYDGINSGLQAGVIHGNVRNITFGEWDIISIERD